MGVAVLGPGKGSNGGFPALRGSADTSCNVIVGEPRAWGRRVELASYGFERVELSFMSDVGWRPAVLMFLGTQVRGLSGWDGCDGGFAY